VLENHNRYVPSSCMPILPLAREMLPAPDADWDGVGMT
jgi:hypothetical protein